jgi:peptidoglycan/LPS O-acetylase OafA/YrhL
MESRTAHLRYVDGLRAIAVLGVIFYHGVCEALWATPWFSAPMQANPAWWFVTLSSKGAHGVDLFFVISGFCLAYPTLARLRQGQRTSFDLRGFLAKRIARIVPPYYAAIALLLGIVMLATHAGLPRLGAVGHDLSPLSILRQALFLDRGADFVNGSFWTLGIELRWYLAFPFLLLLYVRSARTFFALLAACVLAYNFTQLRAIDIGTLPGFMLGIVAADWRIVAHRFSRFALPAMLVAFDLALALEPYASMPSRFGLADDTGYFVQTNIGWQLASFCFVVASGQVAWLRRLLELPVLCAIGVSAYGIYLVHQPIISAWGEHAGLHLDPVPNFAGSVLLALAGGLLFSHLAELPFLQARVRGLIVNRLGRPIAWLFSLAGLPSRLDLGEAQVPAAEHSAPVDAQRERHLAIGRAVGPVRLGLE